MCKHPLGRVPLQPSQAQNRMRNLNIAESHQQGQHQVHNDKMRGVSAGGAHPGRCGHPHNPHPHQHQGQNKGGHRVRKNSFSNSSQNQNVPATAASPDGQHKPKQPRRSSPRKISGGADSPSKLGKAAHSAHQGETLQRVHNKGHNSSPTPSMGQAATTARPLSRSTPEPLTSNYAGAKFSDPPSPKVLPRPPMHWMASSVGGLPKAEDNCTEMTNVLKVMLKVQA